MGLLVVLVERLVGIDCAVVAFAQHQFGVRDVEILAELRARCSLHTMVRPELLLSVGDLDRVERLFAHMRGSKREVPARMPILGEDHVGEARGELVDNGDDLVAVRHGEIAAGAEVVLHVDDQQAIAIGDLDGIAHQAMSAAAR